MNGERGDGEGGAEPPEVEDEFACAGTLRGSLASMRPTVERIFGVAFGIGTLDLPPGDGGQIWLTLRGPGGNVSAAKLFVKGVVNQEEQQELSYPEGLRCVFCGARGLFLDSLIRSTSAHIVTGSPGSLLISGLAEPVVGAYSLISDLLDRYRSAQARRSETVGTGPPGESLDSRRAFKALVEQWEDRHTLDLLVLPSPVKEILLEVVKESGLGGAQGGWRDEAAAERPSPPDSWTAGLGPDPSFRTGSPTAGTRGRGEGAEERLWLLPQTAEEETQSEPGGGGEEVEVLSSMGNKEFWLLLKFFTAMGYTEDVVQRVLAQTGPKEASQILDLVQQEQDRSEQDRQSPGDGDSPEGAGHNGPCESEHTEEEEEEAGEARGRQRVEGGAQAAGAAQEEDFVLGVLKRAAASCGYAERNVAKFYNLLPKESTHQLLLELQRETGREAGREGDAVREGPREMDDVVLEDEDEATGGPAGVDAAGGDVEMERVPVAEPDLFGWNAESESAPRTAAPPPVKGPPMPTYPPPRDPLLATSDRRQRDEPFWLPPPAASRQSHQTHPGPSKPRSSKLQHALQAPPPPRPPQPASRAPDPPTARPRERRTAPPTPSVVVTGEQRFLEGLQAPFRLQLTDAPGDPKLRTVIIDASNVAMSHGLGHFFSCRGIALAVQHFWDRGHRHISAMLPQWRTKSDPKIKEQHYLTELQTVGLLSFTPSREVHGKRITSYDDRLMLQLAQKTDGVIVTNDNLRDLSDESPAYRDIVKRRLLQYTFVGDHFMVPDDPLGRGGPHLDDFLRAEHRTPVPGSHSFAGSASTFPSTGPRRSQTELCNLRDQTLGGAAEAVAGGRQHRSRAKVAMAAARHPGAPDRSPEQTAALREQLCQVFPGQDNMVTLVLQCHPVETDVNALSDFILEQ